MQLGISETTVLHAYHPNAEALFNHTMDLRKTIVELRDPNRRIPTQARCLQCSYSPLCLYPVNQATRITRRSHEPCSTA